MCYAPASVLLENDTKTILNQANVPKVLQLQLPLSAELSDIVGNTCMHEKGKIM